MILRESGHYRLKKVIHPVSRMVEHAVDGSKNAVGPGYV